MSPDELTVALIGFIVALTALIKLYTEVLKIKKDREAVKLARDRDSEDLHDQVLKNTFQIQQLKDAQSLTATTLDDLRDTCAALNTSVAKLDVSSANLADAVKELKRARMD